MPAPSKFYRVAVEGPTIDGRNIQREWLKQAAANYDPEVYGARVWVEHMRSALADSPFSAQGDVIALKAEEIKTGKLAGKMALFAQLKPLAGLLNLNKNGKKMFTSIELVPNFAESGEAYVTGLAVTDEPGSLGTEMLKFSAKGADNKLTSEFMETTLDMEAGSDTDPDSGSLAGQMVKAFSSMLESLRGITAPRHTPETTEAFAAKTLEVLGAADAAIQHQSKELAAEKAAREKLAGEFSALAKQFNELTVKLSVQDGSTTGRPEATGTEGAVLADC
ncbi:capsid scaffolding serine peptidase GPO [Acidovorax sp. 62]|uniref:GPO family capsid scaffolding protein n=1 Tax=Acidovorax sp. 62 TaxID=2035203 RepID=UPI000C17AA87|nr:GPO family capsid scaffolding protein [Acidovorax sp. 62]PIF89726.1 capsid scaffolding serine peptidase GPO [Acidovorax sp. 62]